MQRNLARFAAAGGLLALLACGPAPEQRKTALNGKIYTDPYGLTPAETNEISYDKNSIVVVLDTSGSMREQLGEKRRIDVAKEKLLTMLEQYNARTNGGTSLEMGILYFADETVIRTLAPFGPFAYDDLTKAVTSIDAQHSGTPLGDALIEAERLLDARASGRKHILLITDGENQNGPSPKRVYRSLTAVNAALGDATALYLVAFGTDPAYFRDLQEQGATVIDAQTPQALESGLRETVELILEKE